MNPAKPQMSPQQMAGMMGGQLLHMNDGLLNQLASMGPPPQVQMPQQGPAGPGTALVNNTFQQALAGQMNKPPPMTRGEASTNPSIGQLISQGY
jgi:hypothetical protein